MAKGKNFFYRVNPNEVLAELVFVENREQWLIQFFDDLRNDDPEKARSTIAANIIKEAHGFRQKRSIAGKASAEQKTNKGKQKATYVKHMSTSVQQSSTSSSSSSSSSSSNNKEESIREKTRDVFSPPTLEDVKAYCAERGNSVDPQKWFDFYQSKGWYVGKNKMKDWKAAIRTWEQSTEARPKYKRETLTDDFKRKFLEGD